MNKKLVIRKGMDGWLSLQKVAELMSISHEAARQLVGRGTLPARRRRDPVAGGNARIEVPLFAVVDLFNSEDYQRASRRGCK